MESPPLLLIQLGTLDLSLLGATLTPHVAAYEKACISGSGGGAGGMEVAEARGDGGATSGVAGESYLPPQDQPLTQLLRDALVASVSGSLAPAALATALEAGGLTCAASPCASSHLVDIVWSLTMELESLAVQRSGEGSGADAAAAAAAAAGGAHRGLKEWKALAGLARVLVDKALVPRVACLERLELDFLEAMGLIKSEVARQRLVKANTRALYTQFKYNLLVEESEGWAKLSEALMADSLPASSAAYLARGVLGIAGRFSLDPNRVFQLMLEVMEARLVSDFRDQWGVGGGALTSLSPAILPTPSSALIPLLSGALFSSSNLTQLLGFKFSFFARGREGKASPHAAAAGGTGSSSSSRAHVLSPELHPGSVLHET